MAEPARIMSRRYDNIRVLYSTMSQSSGKIGKGTRL